MTDIYIKRSKSSKKPVIAALLILAAVALIIIWSRRTPPPPTENETIEDFLESKDLPREKPDPKTPEEPGTPTQDSGLRLLAEAKQLQENKQLLEAREICFKILQKSSNRTAVSRTEDMLGDLHTTLVFSPHPMPEKEEYTVQSGDNLAALAKKFNTTIELIRKGNNITGDLIRIGDRMRILTGTFSLEIDKSDNDMVVQLNDRFFKRYRVGTGKFQRTPEGTFKVTDRIARPTWWRPDGKAIPFGDPDNVLGTHWLSLDISGYGIHGTWEPETIGKQESQGCIRLTNENIEELYSLITRDTRVVITE